MGLINQISPPRQTSADVGHASSSKDFPSFGPRMLQHFDFDPDYRNLNQGSFGSSPREIRAKLRQYQDQAEARPDAFIRYELPGLLNASRAAIAQLLRAPTDTVVYVPNATTALNVILRDLVPAWASEETKDDHDDHDEILSFSTLYGGCGKTIDYVVDTLGRRRHGRGRVVSARSIEIAYPCSDQAILDAFHDAVASSRASGRRPRLCVYDTVSSLPGVRFPFEALTRACRDAGVLSVVDGAQGVGMLELDLAALDPDFFFSNCHKWLHAPRACAVLYVPARNQPLIVSPVPTSHGYVPIHPPGGQGEAEEAAPPPSRFNPMPLANPSRFVQLFQFVGTLDTSAYLCVGDAIRWRAEVLGGEARITEHLRELAREGGRRVAEILGGGGTRVLDNEAGTLSRCGMTNVALPVDLAVATTPEVREWMMERMVYDYKTFVPLFVMGGQLWARISAQVYLDVEDFRWAGEMLLELCRRVERGEYRSA
ncbi:PLP-dependent transferase [Xylariomycetidae sp. FL2044]|nr:PLP-dependent transferase [Xylariomycetidae sp. FL2044]